MKEPTNDSHPIWGGKYTVLWGGKYIWMSKDTYTELSEDWSNTYVKVMIWHESIIRMKVTSFVSFNVSRGRVSTKDFIHVIGNINHTYESDIIHVYILYILQYRHEKWQEWCHFHTYDWMTWMMSLSSTSVEDVHQPKTAIMENSHSKRHELVDCPLLTIAR